MALAINANSGIFFSPSVVCSKPPNKSLNFLTIPKSERPFFSLRICARLAKPRIVACLNGRNTGEESFSAGSSSSSSKEASFDLKLPRRSLLVQFTCNACGERTQRTINRVAYERGTVFVQCAGCLVNHKLIDNLGLVVEYDLRKEIDDNIVDSKEA